MHKRRARKETKVTATEINVTKDVDKEDGLKNPADDENLELYVMDLYQALDLEAKIYPEHHDEL